MEKYGKRYNSGAKLPAELLNAFMNYPWPGNIRQLENYIRRFLVLPDDNLLMQEMQTLLPKEQLASTVSFIPAGNPESLLEVAARAAERAERELVRRVLEETGGNRKMAARRMNICYKALLNKLKRWSGPQPYVKQLG